MQGGDFKWSFDNSKDDAESAVNQALKDALVAYKGGTGTVYYGGESSADEPQKIASVQPDFPAIRYAPDGERLEIFVQGLFRVEVLRLDGKKVLSSTANSVDLSGLGPGVYLARLVKKKQFIVKTFLR